MTYSVAPRANDRLFRLLVSRFPGGDLIVVALILIIHLVIRFFGLRDVGFIALSMAILWPLPWLLLHRDGRRDVGIRAPRDYRWLLIGAVIGLLVVVLTVAIVWLALGMSSNNWFVHYGRTVSRVVVQFPPGTSHWLPFLAVAVPAMTLSPVAEEFLFRGLIFRAVRSRWGDRTAMVTQSALFAVAHLANYGLVPFRPVLNLFWLPSMLAAAIVFQYIAIRSQSLWPSVLAHSFYNFGMTILAFILVMG